MAATDTRAQIVEAADQLFYERGFEHTSFADIAAQVQISRGNFYYHFRTKDEILDAVIRQRLENTQAMLDDWEAEGAGPAERITSFIQILIVNQSKIMAFGCPVGTLTSELAKLGHPSQAGAAGLDRGASGRATRQYRQWAPAARSSTAPPAAAPPPLARGG